MHTEKPAVARRFSLSKMVCIVFLFCAAMAIASPAQTFTTLASFAGTNGASPQSSLIQATDGNFYGTTILGGYNNCYGHGCGTIFKITPSGTLTALYSFCSQSGCTDGSSPLGLLQAIDGNFYGATNEGGANGVGTVFKITPGGSLTTLYSFCTQWLCTDGGYPRPGLVQATDGNFYGATIEGGAYAGGTIFKITSSGTLTTVYSFCSKPNCTDGGSPQAGLVQAGDGNFYGTTQLGGSADEGTVFRITTSGTLTTLYSFCSLPNCSDGGTPYDGLVQAIDGNFYGTTYFGGAYGYGTVFKITPAGTLTTLYSYCSQPNCSDGEYPQAGMVQATDGDFYGTVPMGGTHGVGTLFKITPGGSLTTLHSFCSQSDCADGGGPEAALLQATDGSFYGTTSWGGGGNNDGTVFSLSVGLPAFVETQPTSGTFGTPVTILGTNLTGATSVNFNGTAATFNVVSPSEITTAVPVGATTGVVQVTVPGSTLISNTDFQVVGPLQFVPVPPCRLVDTRNGNPIQGGTSQSFIVPQLGGCGIPTSAAAYSLNVTVVPHGPLGYLTIWPNGEIQPYVSTMNSPDGRIKANAAIVPSGNSAVSVYVTNTTDLILDIDGYFAPAGSGSYQFYTLTPCRVVDTRDPSKPQGLGPPSLPAQQARDFPVLTSPCLQNLPQQPQAYSFNVTVVPNPAGQQLGYLTVWPSNEQQPYVSTLNNPTATVVANAAIVPAAPDGDIDAYAYNSTDLVIDVNGYFAAPGGTNALSLYPVAPCRVLDTRQNHGQPFMGELTVNVVGSACAPSNSAEAYVFNATVVPPGSMPYLTLWPDGAPQPYVSTLNAYDGFITSNMAIVPANINDGSIDAYAYALTQLILDISGYFAP
jgi:uncharacterized repeat protein (TIGR03803 family)